MAGLLLHFTSFTQWPKQANENITLCILGDEPLKSYMTDMVQRRPKSRSGTLITIARSNIITKGNVDSCQMIYAAPAQLSRLWALLPIQHRILLVSYSEHFIAQGGMINFVTDDSRVKLEVNLPAVLNAKLKLSSTLLKHATIISGKPHHENNQREENEPQ